MASHVMHVTTPSGACRGDSCMSRYPVLAAACSNGTLRMVDLASATALYQIDEVAAEHVGFAPDGRTIACAGMSGTSVVVTLWEASTGTLTRQLYEYEGGKAVTCLAWSRDSKSLAVASHDGCTRIWQMD